MVRRSIAVALAAMGMLLAASVAQADTGDTIAPQNTPPTAEDGFQAGTCTDPLDVPKCSPETPGLFYKQAGGHPPLGFTQYIVKNKPIVPGTLVETESVPRTIRVDLPVGLTVNPQATPQCTLAQFKADETGCPEGSIVGREEVTVSLQMEIPNPAPPPPSLPANFVVPPMPGPPLNTLVPIYNIVPEFGEPARFGFKIGSAESEVYLEGDVDWSGDYHQGFTIKLPPPNPAAHTLVSRLANEGRKGNGTYITNPTTCEDPKTGVYSTFLRADSVELPNPNFPVGQTPWEAALPPGVEQEGCEAVPFDPSLALLPGTNLVDSPAAPEVKVSLPYLPDENGLEQSHVRDASVTLPVGMGLNPSASPGLAACTDGQFGKGTENPVTCPAASRIGTAEVETQPLPPGSLQGDVYLAQQQGFNPESGDMYRIFINPKSARYDVDVRLIGNVRANAKTGQLTALLLENPQVPFESVTLRFDAGKRVLTSPATCAKQTTTTEQEPWARPGTAVTRSSGFTLSADPGGGACPTTLGARKFAPAFKSVVDDRKAGQYTNLRVSLGRPDGQQELKVANITLPEGLTGKLAGVEYCPEAAITAAARKPGKAELAAWSCPTSSQIGFTSTVAGSGVHPVSLGGRAYLAGPYRGAPLSMVTVTPAVSGPFDLGTVVVRVALHVNPRTAQVQAVSDVIPDVYGGVKLSLRTIAVHVDRPRFMRTPTDCEKDATAGIINGGGSNPLDPAAFSTYPVTDELQPIECRDLGFKPKLHTRLYGPTKRDKNPRIRAILEARNGDANIARTALVLPHSLFLDQSHIRTVCTRVQLAANQCPKAAIYGSAKARSPLLDKPLKGPVYLVSSNHKLPDLVADLRGQVNIRAYAVIGSKRGGLKTVFYNLPDVPVSKFILNMRGGQKSLLVNSENLCKRKQQAFLNIGAQNSRRFKEKNHELRITRCGGGKKGGK